MGARISLSAACRFTSSSAACASCSRARAAATSGAVAGIVLRLFSRPAICTRSCSTLLPAAVTSAPVAACWAARRSSAARSRSACWRSTLARARPLSISVSSAGLGPLSSDARLACASETLASAASSSALAEGSVRVASTAPFSTGRPSATLTSPAMPLVSACTARHSNGSTFPLVERVLTSVSPWTRAKPTTGGTFLRSTPQVISPAAAASSTNNSSFFKMISTTILAGKASLAGFFPILEQALSPANRSPIQASQLFSAPRRLRGEYAVCLRITLQPELAQDAPENPLAPFAEWPVGGEIRPRGAPLGRVEPPLPGLFQPRGCFALQLAEHRIHPCQVFMQRVASPVRIPLHPRPQFGNGGQVIGPKVVDGGERDQALALRQVGGENRLPALLDSVALAFDDAFVLHQECPDVQVLSFDQPLDTLGIVPVSGVLDAVANQQVV